MDARNLWQAFSRTVQARSAAPALVFADEEISFQTLKEDAERCASWLRTCGAGRGSTVVLQLPKRRETYALWLACLREGMIYVFADPRNPRQRTEQILARLRPAVFFASNPSHYYDGNTVVLGDAAAGMEWLNRLPVPMMPAPPSQLNGNDPAYVMFTSGSTGEPKGAVIPHEGILSLMRWSRSLCDPTSMRFANVNPLHFDNSVFDLFCGLMNGATLVPVETSALPNPALWVRRLREGRANVIFAVPTLFQTLEQLRLLTPEDLPDARLFVFGGEGFPIEALRSFYRRFDGHARLLNVYGPTETSCICSSLEIDEAVLDEAKGTFPSLGRMHADFCHMILDSEGREVGPGEAGELWIGGPNVGLGYYSDPDQTERRFRQDPRQSAYRSIWYCSGDLVSQDSLGLLWFHGRADNQVKIRGHRIELEEVDLAVEAKAGISRAVAAVVAGIGGPEIRVAFVADGSVDIEDMRAHCLSALPTYMQPARITQLRSLPLNANGKVDRKAVATLLGESQ